MQYFKTSLTIYHSKCTLPSSPILWPFILNLFNCNSDVLGHTHWDTSQYLQQGSSRINCSSYVLVAHIQASQNLRELKKLLLSCLHCCVIFHQSCLLYNLLYYKESSSSRYLTSPWHFVHSHFSQFPLSVPLSEHVWKVGRENFYGLQQKYTEHHMKALHDKTWI